MAETDLLSTLDDEALSQLGFGLADLQEVALRCMDEKLSRVSTCWTQGLPDSDGAAVVSSKEYDLALRRPPGSAAADVEVERVLRSCSRPERARRALQFSTVNAADLAVDLRPMRPLWGALAIRFGKKIAFVPSSLVLQGLEATTDRMGARLSRSSRYRDRRADVAWWRLGDAMRHLDADVYFPVATGGLRPVLIVMAGERHVIAIDVVSGGTIRRLRSVTEKAVEALNSLSPGVPWDGPEGALQVARDAEMLRLVVVDGPGRILIKTDYQPLAVGLGDLCDTIGRVDDSVELWSFLTEVCNPPGLRCLVSPGLPELRELWTTEGTLNPKGAQADTGLVGWSTDLSRHWDEAVEWDPFDETLTRAGLRSSALSTNRRLEPPNDAQIWSMRKPKHVRLIHINPSLIVDVPLDDLGPLDLELVVNFARLLGLAAEQLEPFRTALAEHLAGLRFVVDANADPPPLTDGRSEELAWVSVGLAREPHPVIALGCDYHLIALFAAHPAEGSRVLGRAITDSFRGVGLHRRQVDAFDAAWSQWQLPVLMHIGEDQPDRPLHVARTIRKYDSVRVSVDLAKRLAQSKVRAVTHRGERAIRVCDQYISPSLLSILTDRIRRYDRDALLRLGANEVGATGSERRRNALSLAAHMSAPWADERRLTASIGEDVAVMLARASQLVLELALSEPSSGVDGVDRIDWAELLATAGEMIEVAQLRGQAGAGLQSMKVEIDRRRRVNIEPDGKSPVSLRNCDVFRRLFALRPGSPNADGCKVLGDDIYRRLVRALAKANEPEIVPFERLVDQPDAPKGLRDLDRSMLENLGTGFDGLLATLRTARSWRRDIKSEFAVTTQDLLVAQTASWSGVPDTQIRSAIDHLSLRPANLREEGNPYWLVEKRRHRLATRPLIEVAPGTIWILPELAAATQFVFTTYLSDGRLPWPDLPGPLRKTMEVYRQSQNRRLEVIAEGLIHRAGFTVCRGLTPRKASRRGVPLAADVGEIDLIVLDARRHRLWVIEAKDPQQPFAPHELMSGSEKFRNRYAPKLRKKAAGIEAVVPSLVASLGGEPAGRWLVLPLFVTSRVELAAFDERLSLPFVTVEDVVELLEGKTFRFTGLFVPKWARQVLETITIGSS
ncbi:MAG: hypothetical protein ACYCZN_15005 [Candidatus Dormibacteria bacterium]